MEGLPKNKFKIHFTKASSYKIIPATGAWGGPTPQGELLCNFFVEYRDAPDNIEMEIEGGRAKEPERIEADFIRELQMGVIIRPDIAKSIGEWLVRKADEIMKPKRKLDS